MNIAVDRIHIPVSQWRIVSLMHLDGREFAQGWFLDYKYAGWDWLCSSVRQEFGADEWAEVEGYEDEERRAFVVTIDGKPVAQSRFIQARH